MSRTSSRAWARSARSSGCERACHRARSRRRRAAGARLPHVVRPGHDGPVALLPGRGSLLPGARSVLVFPRHRIEVDVLEAEPDERFRLRWSHPGDLALSTEIAVRIQPQGLGLAGDADATVRTTLTTRRPRRVRAGHRDLGRCARAAARLGRLLDRPAQGAASPTRAEALRSAAMSVLAARSAPQLRRVERLAQEDRRRTGS